MRSFVLIGCLLLAGPVGAQRDESKSLPAGAPSDLPKPTVSEATAQAPRPAKAEKDRANEERIKELIFQLRDQQASQLVVPGDCEIFWVVNQAGVAVETPALSLAAFEYAAVPHLLAALDDKRLTQAVGKRGKWLKEEYTLRVGDCAYLILERIAARRFSQSSTALADNNEKESAARKEKVQAWWKEFQTKGERRMLIEGAETGEDHSNEHAARLRLRYPDAAFDAMATGIRNARDEWARSSLIETLALDPEVRVIQLLRQELKGPFLHSRLAAARALHQLKYQDGVEAMIAQWQERLTKKTDEEDCDELIYFLVSCNSLDAINALGADLCKRPVRMRYAVISALEDRGWGHLPWHNVVLMGAIERLLVENLNDTEVKAGWIVQRGDKHCTDPRMCDIAGDVLSSLWDAPDAFDLFADLRVRDRQRVELQNRWRSPRGLPILPLPARAYDQ